LSKLINHCDLSASPIPSLAMDNWTYDALTTVYLLNTPCNE